MRLPGSPEEVSTEAGRTTPHFITEFYASAHFKLTPEKFINHCDKCFISLPGCNKMSLEGKLTLHFTHILSVWLFSCPLSYSYLYYYYYITPALMLKYCKFKMYECSLSVQNRTDVQMLLCMLCIKLHVQMYKCSLCML